MSLSKEQEEAIAELQAKAVEYSDASEKCLEAFNHYEDLSKVANKLSNEYRTLQSKVLSILASGKVSSGLIV